jgi:CRISPR-associated exonuclease Cas4
MGIEDELLPLSALQHLLFCERQCALIHIEQQWDENIYTAEGRIIHERVDSGRPETRKNLRLQFAMPLRSLRLGLVGKADVVEFHRNDPAMAGSRSSTTVWQPFPVEYKRGRPKKDDSDRVQLCAQAICLEEMLPVHVPEGALFYGKTKRRLAVAFDSELRTQTESAAARLHQLFDAGKTPAPIYSKKCDRCSFLESCLPRTLHGGKSALRYLRSVMKPA